MLLQTQILHVVGLWCLYVFGASRCLCLLEGFHCEQAAVGAYGFLESPTSTLWTWQTVEQELIQVFRDQQDYVVRAALVSFDALHAQVSSTRKAPGSDLGCEEARHTTSLSVDMDTEAFSDCVGITLGANNCPDMGLMLLASISLPHSDGRAWSVPLLPSPQTWGPSIDTHTIFARGYRP